MSTPTQEDAGAGPPTTAAGSAGAASAAQRRQDILDLVARRSTVRVDELVDRLGVSRMTVHRDLQHLAEKNLVVRVHGGIRRVHPRVTESDLTVRSGLRREIKAALAERAADLVQDGDVLALDDSSTVAFVLDHLAVRHDLTVITHSLALMRDVAALTPRMALIGLGGDYYPETESFLGPGVANQARELRADTVLVSTTALRAGVLYHPDYEAALTKRTLLEVAERRVLLVDATKLSGPGLYRVAALDEFHDVVIDASAGRERIDELREHTDARFHLVGA
ncbi:DeoR/GlpR family DNA-binding transcription regulator [Cellulomonas sp. JZ18]|uniref:DeoR/GlpR family DNA-binding transcription regulator n=1 Tax=Cellulomonas sp. JZ18 TaxID=2654191 RepID=UPI0018AF84F2|nr:DeoR/GlpR family DNA-binding transcription regulator [Cellulomonas sp. JZ18]